MHYSLPCKYWGTENQMLLKLSKEIWQHLLKDQLAKSTHSDRRFFITRNFQSKNKVVTVARVICAKDLSPI